MAEYKLGYTGAQINAAIGRVLDGVLYNLLDNSDFRNPVNQRGATSWSASGYTIDRWRTYSAVSISLTSSGVTVNATNVAGNFQQNISSLPNGTYTFAAYINNAIRTRVVTNDNGTVTTVDNSNAAFTGGYINIGKGSSAYYVQIINVAGYTNTIVWAALYEGAYTADTLPTYQPKGYAAELAACRYYYQVIPEQTSCAFATTAQSSKYFASSINFSPMRITPTVSLKTDSSGYIGVVQGVSFVSASEFDFAYKLNGTLLPATTNANYAGKVMSLYGVELSADL